MTFEKDETILELQCIEVACDIEHENAIELRDSRFEVLNNFYNLSNVADYNIFTKAAYKIIKSLLNWRFNKENTKCLDQILEFERAKNMLKKADKKSPEHILYVDNISKKISDIQQVYTSIMHRKIVED